MPAGKHKTKRFRKVFRRTPGAKVVIQYKQRNPQSAKCGNCGAVLKGIPRLIGSKARNASKTKKRPQRPFGGVLCSKCTRAHIKEVAKSEGNKTNQ